MQHLLTGLVQPKFSGKKSEWSQFETEWENFINKLSVGQELTDQLRLGLLETTLDPVTLKELRLIQAQRRDGMVYMEFFAELKGKFDKDKNMGARRIWQEVQLPNSEKINGETWREFEINFKAAKMNVSDASGEEATRLLMSRLPPFILNWVVEHMETMAMKRPKLGIILMEGGTPPRSQGDIGVSDWRSDKKGGEFGTRTLGIDIEFSRSCEKSATSAWSSS